MYECKICGQICKTQRGLATHFRSHNLTKDEYIEIYGDYRDIPEKDNNLITCPICGKYNLDNLRQHVTLIHKMSRKEFDMLYPNYKCFTDRYREQCSNACKRSLESQMKNPEKWKESRKRSYRTLIKNNPDHLKNMLDAAHKGQSDRLKEMWKDKDYREKMSVKCKKQHENGLTEIVVRSTNNGTKKFKFVSRTSSVISVRSSWEVKLAEFLDFKKIKFKYEPFCINYYVGNELRKYYPDFYIESNNLIIEVKPSKDVDIGINLNKRLRCEELGYKYLYCTENELKDLNSFIEIW